MGPERIEKVVALPPTTAAGWSANGRWLALCTPVPSSGPEQDLHQAQVIHVDGDQFSEPVQVGDCTAFDWAPVSQQLLVRSRSAWRLVDLSTLVPRQIPIAGELAALLDWSPTGRRLLARSVDIPRRLRILDTSESYLRVQSWDFHAHASNWCLWSPDDALVCVVDDPTGSRLEIRFASPTTPRSHVADGRVVSLAWVTPRKLVYELENTGVYTFEAGTATQLFTPGDRQGLDYYRPSPRGGWLLDTASGHLRLWDLNAAPRSVEVSGVSGQLLDPRWSQNGEHAVVSVQHPLYRSRASEVWLLADAAKDPQLGRIASAQPGMALSAWFSPGSQWVIVSQESAVVPLAQDSSSAQRGTPPGQTTAVHVASRTKVALPLGLGDWANDDSAFVAVDRERGLMVFRVTAAAFAPPERVRALEPGRASILWQPAPP